MEGEEQNEKEKEKEENRNIYFKMWSELKQPFLLIAEVHHCYFYHAKESKRETDRDRKTDRQANRQTEKDGQPHRTDGRTERQTGKRADRERDVTRRLILTGLRRKQKKGLRLRLIGWSIPGTLGAKQRWWQGNKKARKGTRPKKSTQRGAN